MRRARAEVVLSLALFVAAVAVHARACGNGFVNFDDETYVVRNPHVRAGLGADGLRWALTSTAASNWHPLTWLSLQADAALYSPGPWGFHLTSVLLHGANVVLVFLVFRGMTGALWRSALAAGLLAVHPLHVESVAWVAERKDVLSAFFGWLAVGAYARYAERPSVGRYLPVALALALSLLAKPMWVTLPALLLLLDYWPLGRRTPDGARPRLGRLAAEKIPLLALSAGSSTITIVAQRGGEAIGSLDRLPLAARVGNALVAYVRYLGKAFWPVDLAVFYPHAGDRLPFWEAATAGAGLLAVSAIVLALGRRFRYLPVGWFWYLVALVPVIGLVQVGSQSMADRYTYLPLVGIYVGLSWAVADAEAARQASGARRVGTAVALAALVLLAARTWNQIGTWHDSVSLWRHALAVTSDNYLAHHNLGKAWDEAAAAQRDATNRRQTLERAVREYESALRLKPDLWLTRYNLGVALAGTGELHGATVQFEQAVRINPDFALGHYNLALALAQQGNAEAAAAEARAVERLLGPEAPAVRRLAEQLRRARRRPPADQSPASQAVR